MTWLLLLVIGVALLLAFANGANDNGKGVATLIGSGTLSLRAAVWLAAGATLAGSVAALWLAGNLAARFSGKGIVEPELVANVAFPLCIGLAAAVTVLLATRLGMPVSTTHALVGAMVGIGASAGALHWQTAAAVLFLPLLASPLASAALAAVAYVVFRFTRKQLGVGHQLCVCIKRQYHPVTVHTDGAIALKATGLTVSSDLVETCRQRYDGQLTGVEAQTVLNWSHVGTAAAVSFARGLNDTPKIAALLIAATAVGGSWLHGNAALVLVAVAMAAGGLLAVRRVVATMSYRITAMNDGQAFTANLVTALLVICASTWGLPVSTTHVSCGSLFGIGTITRQAHGQVIGQILLAWVTTLPLAALLGASAWQLFT